MSCKYKYNNQWYTKEEVFNLLLKEKGINSKGGLIKPKITNNKIEGRTNETLKESIESITKKLTGIEKRSQYVDIGKDDFTYGFNEEDNTWDLFHPFDGATLHSYTTESEAKEAVKEYNEKRNKEFKKEKEYTSQALINTKIAALKEVAKKYPRSLIRSEVKSLSDFNTDDIIFFQKLPNKSPILNDDGTRKKWLEKDYDKVLEVIKPLNKKYNNQFEIIKTTGEKGDRRVYYSIAVKEGKYTKDTDSVNILSDIANSKHPLNKVARQLIPFVKKNNVPVMFTEKIFVSKEKKSFVFIDNKEPDFESAGGIYVPNTNLIYISTKTLQRGSQESIIIHEILHSLSFKELRKNQSMLDDFEKLRVYAVEQLKDKNFDKYGLTNTDEFLVALYTDGKLIKELMTLPPLANQKKYKNLLEEIFDYILSLFNMGKSNPTLFNQAFDLSTQFFDYSEQNIELPIESFDMNVEENYIFSQEEIEQDFRYQIKQDTLTREMFKEQFPTLGLNDNQIDNVIAAIENGDINIKCNL